MGNPSDTILALRGVSKSYRQGEHRHRVLSHVDADFHRGEIVVITGPSGTGKSTLLNIAGGIDHPDAGEVHVGGRLMSAASDRERTLHRRRHIGFVFQFLNLLPTLTVGENLLLPLELNRIHGATARARAGELLEKVGLGGRWGDYPDVLSGGEQQRVAVARALVHAPSIVLADEPTGNLDEIAGREVLTLLRDVAADGERMVLVVTHSPIAAEMGDRVLRIHGGQVVPA